jgi:hypothetical protein
LTWLAIPFILMIFDNHHCMLPTSPTERIINIVGCLAGATGADLAESGWVPTFSCFVRLEALSSEAFSIDDILLGMFSPHSATVSSSSTWTAPPLYPRNPLISFTPSHFLKTSVWFVSILSRVDRRLKCLTRDAAATCLTLVRIINQNWLG